MKNKLINGIVSMSKIKVSMNKDQFIAYKKGDMSLLDIKMFDKVFNQINKNKVLKLNVIIGIACLLVTLNSNTALAIDATSKIDDLGSKSLVIIQVCAYWLCLIMCGVSVMKAVLSGKDKKDIGEIILGFLLAFAAVYFMPWLFDIVKSSFGGGM